MSRVITWPNMRFDQRAHNMARNMKTILKTLLCISDYIYRRITQFMIQFSKKIITFHRTEFSKQAVKSRSAILYKEVLASKWFLAKSVSLSYISFNLHIGYCCKGKLGRCVILIGRNRGHHNPGVWVSVQNVTATRKGEGEACQHRNIYKHTFT